jgi:hypothetical protein
VKNVINIILKQLYTQIPLEILNEAFKPVRENRTLDALIKEKIIVDLVLVRCNLYSGRTKKIMLLQEWCKRAPDNATRDDFGSDSAIYVIPPNARENRAISVVLDLAHTDAMAFGDVNTGGYVMGLSVENRVDELLSSFTRKPAYIAPTPILLNGEAGIIRISPPMALHNDWVLSCMLAYDKDFTNIGTNVVQPLQKLVLYSTQAYIYNKLIVSMNQGYLQGGLQLDAIKEIVMSYADAYEKMEEAFMQFRGASMFEKETLMDYLSIMMGS